MKLIFIYILFLHLHLKIFDIDKKKLNSVFDLRYDDYLLVEVVSYTHNQSKINIYSIGIFEYICI